MSRIEWRSVKGYAHRFEVSNYGAVRSLPRKYILKPWTDKLPLPLGVRTRLASSV